MNELTRKLVEADKAVPSLSNKGMQDMIPTFVESQSKGEDHRCGSCNMRIVPNACTVVKGDIDMEQGVCLLWAKGQASKPEDRHEMQLPKEVVGYVEQKDKINCSTCKAYAETPRGGYCKVWEGKVGPGDCCIVWWPKES